MDRKAKIRVVSGCVLVVVSIFATISLFSYIVSYYSIDHISSTQTVTDTRLPNWCGRVGDWFAQFLVGAFGTPASFFAVGLAVFWSYLLFTYREKLPDAYFKIFGTVVFVISVSALTALAGQSFGLWPSVLGIVIARGTIAYFGVFGSYLFLLLLCALSLLLATDFMIVAPAGRILLGAGRFLRAAVTNLSGNIQRRREGPHEVVPTGKVTRPEPAATVARKSLIAKKQDEADEDEEEEEALPLKRSTAAKQTETTKRAEPAEAPKKTLELVEASKKQEAVAAKNALGASDSATGTATLDPPKPKLAIVEAPKPALPAPAEKTAKPAPKAEPAAKPTDSQGYIFPPLSLLDDISDSDTPNEDQYIQEKAKILEDTLAEFNVSVRVVGVEPGPTITQYELELAPGIKVNRVLSLTDDIAMALKAPSVRIVAPIPGRDSVGVEVPNTKTAIVRLKGLFLEAQEDRMGPLPMYLGRDAQGVALVADLAEMPHLLIAGATGAGKSVCINSVILSVLMKQHPDDVKLLLVDPKMVELSVYKDMPHLICPVVTDMKKASSILEWACVQMDNRYDCLAAVNVRHISRYNKLGPKGIRERLSLPPDAQIELPDKLPYIIIIIDELADLMMVAAKDVETSITRLAQKSRAVGIHLVLATQRPSVDVITGLIKSNLPARLSFKVSSRIDSRTILDQNGADKLLGRGDMLFLPPATAKLVRAQGTYVSDDEIRRVVEFVKSKKRPDYDKELVGWEASGGGEGLGVPGGGGGENGERDPLYDQAVEVVIENQRGSVSLLQRRLEIGYSRAARLIDFMAEGGILGPYKGSQAREVLFTPEQWEEMKKENGKRRSLS